LKLAYLTNLEIYPLLKERIFLQQLQQQQKTCFVGCSSGEGQSKLLWKHVAGADEAFLQKVIP
jgi:hypothetical protein